MRAGYRGAAGRRRLRRTAPPVGGILQVRARAPDPDLIDQVAADDDRAAYWLDRLRRVAAITLDGTFVTGRIAARRGMIER